MMLRNTNRNSLNPLSAGKSFQTDTGTGIDQLRRLNPLSAGKSFQTLAGPNPRYKNGLNPLSAGKSFQTRYDELSREMKES